MFGGPLVILVVFVFLRRSYLQSQAWKSLEGPRAGESHNDGPKTWQLQKNQRMMTSGGLENGLSTLSVWWYASFLQKLATILKKYLKMCKNETVLLFVSFVRISQASPRPPQWRCNLRACTIPCCNIWVWVISQSRWVENHVILCSMFEITILELLDSQWLSQRLDRFNHKKSLHLMFKPRREVSWMWVRLAHLTPKIPGIHQLHRLLEDDI